MTWKRILLIGAVLLALGMTGMQATPAHAASTLTVSTCDESHLSAAVTQANTDNDGDRITFRCNGTITLTSTLSIIGSMTIDGTGQNVIIDGGGNVELINVSAALELDQLTLSGGSNTFGAGVFNNHGTLNTIATTFSNDTATSGSGGAIYNNGGTALIQGSTFSGNSAQNGAPGGAIENVAGQVTIIASSFSNNTGGYGGGAINNEGGGTVNVSGGSSFSTDSGGYGGAILSIGATLSVSDSTFSGNSAANEGGAISHSADMNITNCLFLSNSAAAVGGLGGALDNEGGTSKIKGSTFQGNSAQVGGAITSSGSAIVQIDNSTFSSNTVGSASPAVTGDGGAIANGAATTITASTFSKNVAYGT
ncbi:MAG TPA: hypothetical protein VF221_18635, partial [Chloroflexota bacterium]